MLFEFRLPIPSLPVPLAAAAGALAGLTGLMAVVSGALQRQSYVWLLCGIVGMGVGIATGLTMVQAG